MEVIEADTGKLREEGETRIMNIKEKSEVKKEWLAMLKTVERSKGGL